ncbi:hypothetical protein Dsin_000576 [Dipteronia sinensis]|uniref:Uncharacterized protein n=1 Tax=Dipteronia sinensis TaxID=43782 RepID=A0AAE0B3Q3_9ROSI|nr:hypothetical protein Dsin_000576 [Dipteronia sinensis]
MLDPPEDPASNLNTQRNRGKHVAKREATYYNVRPAKRASRDVQYVFSSDDEADDANENVNKPSEHVQPTASPREIVATEVVTEEVIADDPTICSIRVMNIASLPLLFHQILSSRLPQPQRMWTRALMWVTHQKLRGKALPPRALPMLVRHMAWVPL